MEDYLVLFWDGKKIIHKRALQCEKEDAPFIARCNLTIDGYEPEYVDKLELKQVIEI